MKLLLVVVSCLLGAIHAAEIVDPDDCTEFPCLIFNDDFDFLDHDAWEHEITMAGGGNWEFQAYLNNRSLSYTKDGHLYIKPGLTNNWLMDDNAVYSASMDLWGMNGRGDVCTGNQFYGCQRYGTSDNLLNPIMSARLRTQQDFSFRFGKVEIMARMPSGAWLWPAVWMLPSRWGYGAWPSSGEIDIIESRGNEDYGDLGVQHAASTLHWGPNFIYNRYPMTQAEYVASDGSFANSMHKWTLDWTDTHIQVSVDDVLQLNVEPPTSFWDMGNFADENVDNPWVAGSNMAPFDQKMYLILNLAIGGTGGFFPDGIPSNPAKPWSNTSPVAMKEFWEGRDSWLPTWEHGEGKISEKAALEIDYIKVYKMQSAEM